MVTPLIIWKAVRFNRNREGLSKRCFFFRFQNVAIWVAYHFTFLYLYLYVCDLIKVQYKLETPQIIVSSWKYCGFIVLGCLLLGGAMDIINLLIELGIFLKIQVISIRQFLQ